MSTTLSTTPGNILIVDDEYSVRDSLYHWFRKDGYEVKAVENATETLKALQDQTFHVALLDIKMPGMDGMELQEHIHRIDPQIAVIMITAFAAVDTAVRALKQGAFDYVTKPIDPDELSHLVLRALEQRRLRDENSQLREAQLDGRAAIVSAYRLDCQLYGLPPDRRLLFDRLCKEAIHELGHTYHLLHCQRHPCVMMSSTYVESIDLKSERFCARCQKAVTNPSPQGEH